MTESSTVIRGDDIFLNRVHRLLSNSVAPDTEDPSSVQHFLLPVSALLAESKNLVDDLKATKTSVGKLEMQVATTLDNMFVIFFPFFLCFFFLFR